MSALNQLRKKAFRLHSWLGLISGVFLLLLGLSGSMIVFMKEIDQSLHADLLRVKPAAEPLPLDVIYRKIVARRPAAAGIAWLNPDAGPDRAYEFRIYQNDGRLSTYDLGMMTIDPYTGKVLRDGELRNLRTGLMHWLVQFHWSFQMGIPGLLLATVFGLTMLLSTITGFVIYRRHVWKVLTFRAGIAWKNWRTIASGLHRVVGVWSLVFNLIIFFTGFWMNKFSFDPGYWNRQKVASPAAVASVSSIDSMLAKARQAFPDLVIKNVYLPTQPGKNFVAKGVVPAQEALFYNGNSVAIDPQTAGIVSIERLSEQGLATRAEATFFQLHAGHFGGTPVKILYVILGLTPGLLAITGALLWIRRRRRQFT
ncbi:PepSY domain-containing protein [Pedobacter sp. SYP-B3415]|uniref:PepSY-associated TM helix domain-containing protein n=1 Tax=Pedobacter sp. SYP-B3415 TaxID=2496641 RepID=UPI00101BB827|nr:PepSY-associated TM helix domain-containing protein [Pedobacter sp. SYP-B3415]